MSECGCVWVDTDDCEQWRLENRLVTARKDHKCYECGDQIKKGDQYKLEKLADVDGISTYKTCMTCFEIRKAFFCQGWWYGQVSCDLREHIREMGGKISSDCIAPLPPAARERVCDMIEEVWEGLGDEE